MALAGTTVVVVDVAAMLLGARPAVWGPPLALGLVAMIFGASRVSAAGWDLDDLERRVREVERKTKPREW